MSKLCINCGIQLEENAVFCDECGTKQPELQSSQQGSLPTQQQAANQSNYGQTVINNLQTQSGNQILDAMRNLDIGTVSFISGIIAICTVICLFIPGFMLMLDILSITMTIIALSQKNTKKSLAIAGLAMCIISTLLVIIILILL